MLQSRRRCLKRQKNKVLAWRMTVTTRVSMRISKILSCPQAHRQSDCCLELRHQGLRRGAHPRIRGIKGQTEEEDVNPLAGAEGGVVHHRHIIREVGIVLASTLKELKCFLKVWPLFLHDLQQDSPHDRQHP